MYDVVRLPDEPVEAVVDSPKVNVSDALLLLELVIWAVLVCVELPKFVPVAMMVPLIKETSKVEVAVTVTVRSNEVVVGIDIVPLTSERGREIVLELDIDDVIIDPSSDVDGVAGGEVIVSWVESVALPVMMVEFDETPGMVTDTAVRVPTSVKETTAPVVATGTSVTTEVTVPSLTFTSTTLAVTVASGARGKRYMPAFLRGNTGLAACW